MTTNLITLTMSMEYEAVALNSLLELDGAEDDRQAGDAIQLQLADFTVSPQWGKQVARANPSGSPKERGKERS